MKKIIVIICLLFLAGYASGSIVLIDSIAPKNDAFNVLLDFTYLGDAGSDAAVVWGEGLALSTATLSVDTSEMVGNVTWDDGSTDASITWTWALSGADDPVFTIANDLITLDDSFTVVGTIEGGTITDGTAQITGGALTGLTTALTVAQGGTGATSLNDGFVLLGSNTAAITPLDVTTDGAIVIGDGTTDPTTLDVGSSTAITILGTIATGVWQGTAIADGYVPDNITIDLATLATTVTITDNESTAENNPIVFVADAAQGGGSLGLETDGTCYYTPSTGVITTTGFAGALTGNVTGNTSGSSGSCTGESATVATITTLAPDTATTQAAQPNITSVGTLTSLSCGTITSTGNLVIADDGYIGSTTIPQTIQIDVDGHILSGQDDSLNLGDATHRFGMIYVAGDIHNGTNGVTVAEALAAYTHIGESGGSHSQVVTNTEGITNIINGTTAFTGDVTFNEDIIIGDGKYIGSAADPDAIQIEADGDVVLTQELHLTHASGNYLKFGPNLLASIWCVNADFSIRNTNHGRDIELGAENAIDGTLRTIILDPDVPMFGCGIAYDGLMDLGTATHQWKDFYIAGDATIGGSVTIGVDAAGVESIRINSDAAGEYGLLSTITGTYVKLDAVGAILVLEGDNQVSINSTAGSIQCVAATYTKFETGAGQSVIFDAGGLVYFRDQDDSDNSRMTLDSGTGNLKVYGVDEVLRFDFAGATGHCDIVGDLTAGTIQADNGVSGTLVLDDGTTERITLVFTGGVLTSRTVAATTALLIDWTD